jgi:adenylate kinase family enzyme
MRLADLGDRICVLGQSGSGKSTFSDAIARTIGSPVVHLDQLRFAPGEHFRPRPDDDFAALHDAAVAAERWVVDGNYSAVLPRRLERATGVVLLDATTAQSLGRYVTRTLGFGAARVGGLDGVSEHLSWEMIRWILGPARSARTRRRAQFEALTLPKLLLPDRAAVNAFLWSEGIVLPT